MTTIRFQEEAYSRAAHALTETAHALNESAARLPAAWGIGLPGLEARLNACKNRTHAVADQAKRLSVATRKAASLLEACEKRQTAAAAVSVAESKNRMDWADLIDGAIGEFGVFGGILGPAINLFRNIDGKSMVKMLGATSKQVAKWIDVLDDKDANHAKELFGLTPYLKAATGKTLWAQALSKEFDLSKLGNKIGLATSFAVAAVDSFAEWWNRDISADRAVVETVVQGATSYAIKGLTKAAIGTALVAIAGGPVVGSAVVVGVASYAVPWAADSAFKAITHSDRGIAETLGDNAGAFYDSAKSSLSEAGEHIGGLVDSAGDVVASWSQSITRGLWGGLRI